MIPHKVLNDLIKRSQKVDHEIGGCFRFVDGKYNGHTLMNGDSNFIEIPLDGLCTVSFHSHPSRGGHLGYKIDPPSPGDMKDTIGKERRYILLTKEGVYEYGSIASDFHLCDYILLYEIIHTDRQMSEEDLESLRRCIELHHGPFEYDILMKQISMLSGDNDSYLEFVDYLFQLMGSYLCFTPYPLKEDYLLVSEADERASI